MTDTEMDSQEYLDGHKMDDCNKAFEEWKDKRIDECGGIIINNHTLQWDIAWQACWLSRVEPLKRVLTKESDLYLSEISKHLDTKKQNKLLKQCVEFYADKGLLEGNKARECLNKLND